MKSFGSISMRTSNDHCHQHCVAFATVARRWTFRSMCCLRCERPDSIRCASKGSIDRSLIDRSFRFVWVWSIRYWYVKQRAFAMICLLFHTSRSGLLTQQRASNSTSQNLENEYIKQLQEQIYYLETECLYLYPFSVEISSRLFLERVSAYASFSRWCFP